MNIFQKGDKIKITTKTEVVYIVEVLTMTDSLLLGNFHHPESNISVLGCWETQNIKEISKIS